MAKDQQEIRRKLRILDHAAASGDVSKTVTIATTSKPPMRAESEERSVRRSLARPLWLGNPGRGPRRVSRGCSRWPPS